MYSFDVNENLGLSRQFDTVTAIDPDEIESTIRCRMDNKFQIAEQTGRLSLIGNLDREQVASYI